MAGWIKIHRKITQWEWYSDVNTRVLFLHLLFVANYEEKRWLGEIILPGQFVTGRDSLASQTGLSERQVRTALDKLKSTSEITIKSSNKYSVITICNWQLYQEENKQIDQQMTSQRPADDQPATTTKEVKKERKKESISKYTSDFENFWREYPRHDCSKSNAFKIFMSSIDLTTSAQAIVDGAKTFSTKVKHERTENKYIAHAEKWLRGRLWEADYTITKQKPMSEMLRTGREGWND